MNLALYGAGGLGREIYEIAQRRNMVSNYWGRIIFVDDFAVEGDYYNTKRVRFETLQKVKTDYEVIVAVGEPSARKALFEKLSSAEIKLATLIDPTAIISPSANIGAGVVVCEFSTIHSGVVLGSNSLVQPFCDIGHDINVGKHTVLSPYCVPGGYTIIGEEVFIGMKVAIMEKLHIGNNAIIGMGAAVFRDVPDGATVVGNPARITRGNDEHKVFVK
jgi:sugar O-acyltransferase (sialic acid O-acetyltransferase NeuD family)